MTHLSSISNTPGARVEPIVHRAAKNTPAPEESRVRVADSVDISELARRAARAEPPYRADLVERIKGEIDAGIYESTEKIEGAVDQVIRDLDLSA